MLTQEAQDALATVTQDPVDERRAMVTFSPVPGELADIAVGEIFILPPTKPLARGGLMLRVDSVAIAGNTLAIAGTQPPLTDVIKDGEIGDERTLTADDVDLDATVAAMLPGESPLMAGFGPRPLPTISVHWPRIDFTDDTVLCEPGPITCSVVGHLTLPDPQFNVQVDFAHGTVVRTQFRVNVDAELAIEVRGRISTPGLGSSVRLATIFFVPIWLGPYCVVQPRLTIRLGAKATFMFDTVASGFAGGAHLQAGSEWVLGRGVRDLSSATATGTAHAEGLSQTTLQADIYSRAEFGFFFYFVGGPYVYFEQGPRMDLATPRHPFARVGYHVGTGMGGRLDILDEALLSLIDYSHVIYEYTAWFWMSSNSNPAISLWSPSSYTAVQPNDDVAFSVTAYDVEDGPILDSQVTWSSDIDGVIGTGRNLTHRFRNGGPGLRTVTVTVRDSDGGTDTRTVGIDVAAAAPTITLLDPQPSPTTYATNTPVPLSADVTSPYFPVAGSLCADPQSVLYWSSSNKIDDTIDLAGQTSCSGTVTFTTPGTRVMTFRARDRFGQVTFRSVTVTAVAPQPCSVTVTPSPSPDLTNTGGQTSVTLTANISAGCLQPAPHYFVISSTANGGYHERIYDNATTITFNPTTDVADDGSLMIKPFDTSVQTIDVNFTIDYDDGMGTHVGATTNPPLHLHYTWH